MCSYTLDCIWPNEMASFSRLLCICKGNKHPMTPIRCRRHYGPTPLTVGSRQCRLSASSGLPQIVTHSGWNEAKRHPAPTASPLFWLHYAFLSADLWHKSCTSHSESQTVVMGWLKHILQVESLTAWLLYAYWYPHVEKQASAVVDSPIKRRKKKSCEYRIRVLIRCSSSSFRPLSTATAALHSHCRV